MKYILLILTLLLQNFSYAYPNQYEFCFNKAGDHYNIPPNLLKIIARVESRMNPYAINVKNMNGSMDIGLMQINTSWLKKLKTIGVSEKDLLDGCTNIQIGAWILSQNIKRYGLTTEAIGRYNSAKPYYKDLYVQRVLNEYNKSKYSKNI